MNIYSVYTDSKKKNNELILIRQSFSFIAGFFSFFWALYHKMWSLATIIIVTGIYLKHNTYIIFYLNLIITFIFTFLASDIREYYAIHNGYSLSDIILAQSQEEAEIKYFRRKIKNS